MFKRLTYHVKDGRYSLFKCGCGGDIEIDDESLILAEFARQLKEAEHENT